MPTMNIGASIPAARQLVEAVEKAGGTVPPVLTHLLAGVDLLAQQPAPTDPTKRIVEAAAAGELTQERLTDLLAQAARDAAAADYRGQIRARCESAFLERFFKALVDGSADAILDSLREPFTEAAQALADALTVVDINADPRELAERGTPEQLDAWRSIKPTVAKLDEIAAIARRFGPRSVDWAVLDLPGPMDPRGLTDEAIMLCADDIDVVQAGAVFRARTAAVNTVPWLRLRPRLNTISQAQERLREWAAAEWDHLNANPEGHFDENGNVVPHVRANPYRANAKQTADA